MHLDRVYVAESGISRKIIKKERFYGLSLKLFDYHSQCCKKVANVIEEYTSR